MLRNLLITAIWIVVASNAGSELVAQESGPRFRFDSDQTLSLRSEPKSGQFVSSDARMRVAVDFKKIRVLSDSDDSVLHEIATPNRAMAPTFSPDQKSLVFADCTGNLACESRFYVHQFEGGNQTTLGSCLGATTQIAFSANGKRVAAVSVYGPILAPVAQRQFRKSLSGEIVVFDLETRSELLHVGVETPGAESAAHEAKPPFVDRIALDNDGTTLLVTASSGVVKVIDVNTGAEKISIVTPTVVRSSKD